MKNTGFDKKEEKCCGGCCWFKYEDIYGDGSCVIDYINGAFDFVRCSDEACESFISNEQMRHYQAVLLQANRYRRDQNVPSIYRMPNPIELGKAIDFACECIRCISKL